MTIAVIACAAPRASARSVDRARASGHAEPPHAHSVTLRADARPRNEARSPATPRSLRAPSVPGEGKSLLPSRHSTEKQRPERSGASRPKRAAPPPRPLRPIRVAPPNAPWRAYRKAPWQRGFVTLFGHGKKWSGYLVDKYGDVIPQSRRSLSGVLSSWRTGKEMLMDDRLLTLIADVSDEFGGRAIRIVGGYREHSYAPDSRHKTGEAFDFSVPDVPNEAVRDFLRSIPDVGVGYYPNSTHVHLDVRDKPTYWVDYSRPGDRPVYAWDRRIAGYTPAERALAAALDSIVSHTRESSPQTGEQGGHAAPRARDREPEPAEHARPSGASPAPHRDSAVSTDRDDAEDEHEDDADDADAVNTARLTPAHGLVPRAPPASVIVRR